MNWDLARRILIALGAGLLGAGLLAAVYFGIVSLAESTEHALDQFQREALYVIPLLVGFGLQSALFVGLRRRLFMPNSTPGASARVAGASGGTSAAAMVACCAHHVTDVLPILGLTAATSLLAQYQQLFMILGLITTLGGSAYMLRLLLRERDKAISTAGAVEAI